MTLTLLWSAVTIAAYLCARALDRRARSLLTNPAIVSIAALIAILLATGTAPATYAAHTRWLTDLLGPAIVALGVALHRSLHLLRRHLSPIAISLLAGAVVGSLVAIGAAALLGASPDIVRSLTARSATTPISMAITTRLGGIAPLAALVSIVSGAVGGSIGPALLRLAGVRSPLATGLALGASSHGFGTARAVDLGEIEGAAAGLALGATGALTALLAPALLHLLLSAR